MTFTLSAELLPTADNPECRHQFVLRIGGHDKYNEVEIVVTWVPPKGSDPLILMVEMTGEAKVMQANMKDILTCVTVFLSAEFHDFALRESPVLALV